MWVQIAGREPTVELKFLAMLGVLLLLHALLSFGEKAVHSSDLVGR
jgi:hypothetical protein